MQQESVMPSLRAWVLFCVMVSVMSGVQASGVQASGVQAAPSALPSWSLAPVNAPPLDLADWQGHWVVVNFWATWCAPCIKELPALAAFARDNAARARVLGMNYQRIDDDKLLAFMAEHGVDFPVATWSPSQPQTPVGKIKAVPTTVVFDPEGRVVLRHLGELDQQQLEALLDVNSP